MSEKLKILFVCAQNKKRSPTAERIYKNDTRLAVRSAGVRSNAQRVLSESDLKWADVVFVMEHTHKARIKSRFTGVVPSIQVLDIPDDFEFMDVELQDTLRSILDPVISSLVDQGY